MNTIHENPKTPHGEGEKLYIVISQTGTILSRVLKLLTRKPYNHSSVSLRRDLHVLWSFGRLNPYNPFIGGFVKESPYHGTFKRFYKTTCKVLEVDISKEAYADLAATFEDMLVNREDYHYNVKGLFLVPFHYNYQREKHYYCSEFVRAMAVRAHVEGADTLPEMAKPIDFLSLPHRVIYEGSLLDYANTFPRTDI